MRLIRNWKSHVFWQLMVFWVKPHLHTMGYGLQEILVACILGTSKTARHVDENCN